MSTSKRISLYFTWFATALLLIFAVVINIAFLWEWRRHENRRIQPAVQHSRQTQKQEKRLWVNINRENIQSKRIVSRFTDSITVPYTNQLQEAVLNTHIRNVVFIEDERYIYKVIEDEIVLSRITPFIGRQIALAWMSLWGLFIFALLSYMVSRRVVSRWLRNLTHLADHVSKIHIDMLHKKIDFPDLPDDDEIKIVANEINTMQSDLQSQIDQIKRFIANVSHEFKTPLMVMQSSLELAHVTKSYDQAITQSTSEIQKLQSLLDTLMQIHQWASPESTTHEESEDIYIQPLMQHIIDIQTQHIQKNQDITIDIQENVSVHYPPAALDMILTNLIQNSLKYTPEIWSIHISAHQQTTTDQTVITICDSWPWISAQNLEHIREPFWQWDKSRHIDQWFWLGLSIVKSLIDRHGWRVEYSQSELGGCQVDVYI